MAKVPREIAGFIALPVTFPALRAFPEDVKHYIYVKTHDPKIPEEDAHRSLFLVNIPIATTELHLRHLFGTQLSGGLVESVRFSDTAARIQKDVATAPAKANRKRKRQTAEELELGLESLQLPEVWESELHASGSHAVVVFVDRPSMEASLKAAKRAAKLASEVVWGEGIEDRLPAMGLERYKTHNALQYPSRRDLLRSVDEYMSNYAKMEEARARENAKKRQIADDDGFVTVTKGAPRAVVLTEEAKEVNQKSKTKSTGLEDFYRFQMREKRKEHQGEMMRKFEEDKRRVEEMKKRRGKLRPE